MPPVLTRGETGDWVKYLQQVLHTYDYFRGEPNGHFDDATMQAVQALQRRSHLPDNGTVDDATWHALGIADQAPDPNAGKTEAHQHHAGGHGDAGADHDYGTGLGHHTTAERVHDILTGAELISSVANAGEILGALHVLPEAAGLVIEVTEAVFMLVGGVWATIDAVNSGEIIDHNMGRVYGAMYAAYGWDGPTSPPHSESGNTDHSHFFTGVTEGRDSLHDHAVANRLRLAIAAHGAEPIVAQLWEASLHSVHGGIEHDLVLSWPEVGISGLR